jgi:putative oxidoreductase
MKITVLIARSLLGLVFLVFGLDKFIHFIPAQMPPGVAGQFAGILFTTRYLLIIGAIETVTGLLFLLNRYVPLALTLVGPVIVNILIFGALMQPGGLPPGIVVTILWFILFYYHRAAFAGIFTQNA